MDQIAANQLRFIELMETGESDKLFHRHHVSGEKIRWRLLEQNWQPIPRYRSDGPAQVLSTLIIVVKLV